jgi:hypothetical protein
MGIRKEPINKWTYDLTGHMMVDLETILALGSYIYITNLDACMLHLGDEEVFNHFIDEC